MTSLIGRTVTSSTCKLLKNFGQKCIRVTDHMKVSPRYSICDIGKTRGYHWSMVKTTQNMDSLQFLSNNLCKKCDSRRMHTEGDKEFSEFLEKEIKIEKSSDSFSKPLPSIEDWDIKTDESNVTMTKTVEDELITVTFNTVDSVNTDDTFGMDEVTQTGEDEEQIPAMESTPTFKVEIKKPSGKVLSFQCSFPLEDVRDMEETSEDSNEAPAEDDDLYEIDSVAIYENKQLESSYSVLSSSMEGTMYDMLMDLLHDRGITSEFANVLVDYSTGYEQRQYVNFLKDLKSFVDEK